MKKELEEKLEVLITGERKGDKREQAEQKKAGGKLKKTKESAQNLEVLEETEFLIGSLLMQERIKRNLTIRRRRSARKALRNQQWI